MCGYPRDHYMNTGNVHSPLYVYCEDALRLDGRGLCGACLFRREDEDGTPRCSRDSSGDGDSICPFLELNPHPRGNTTRRRKGGQGEGFDYAQLAKNLCTHVCVKFFLASKQIN